MALGVMRFTDLLESIRRHYLDVFVEMLESHGSAISEPVLLDGSGNPVTEGSFDLPVRLDLVPVNGGVPQDSIRVNANEVIMFSPIAFTWENRLEILLKPFQWDSVHLQAQGPSPNPGPIIGWFSNWFREAKESGGPELLEAVHFLSDPIVESDSLSCEIDLGSAPIEAFFELMDAVVRTGAGSVLINNAAA